MLTRTTAILTGLGAALGAGVMYLLDPKNGRRRRALLGDKLTRARHEVEDKVGQTARDAKNRAKGLAHETRSQLESDEVPDDVLVDRVRSEMGHVIDHPGEVTVTALGGRVTLSGEVKPDEVERLTKHVSSVSGVQGVDNRLGTSKAQATAN